MNIKTPDIKIIYTDGGAHNENSHMHGIGSSAWMIPNLDNPIVDVYGIKYKDTTNNRTEMLAVINAIKQFGDNASLNIISDSGYLVKGYNDPSYLDSWIKYNWKTASKTPVKNRELWEELISLSWHYPFRLQLIRGHNRDKNLLHAYWNDIVDRCCTYLMNTSLDNDVIYHIRFDTNTQKIIEVTI